jgi:3-dehydroquinate synthase
VGSGLIERAGALVTESTGAKRIALVTDENVAKLIGMKVDVSLARTGLITESMTIPAGEASKSWQLAGQLVEELATAGLSRTDAVVALGGGVVGDLAGFAAAVYQRGVTFVQIPTTLLAMVDSSVGGKTAVDLRAGKNLAGAFKQPAVVIADVDVLATLPDSEWRSGLAEVAKSAVLDGDEFLEWLEGNAPALLDREPAIVSEAIVRCVRFKAGIVARDEKEEGPRECLNYGHTFGHGLESALGYGTISHGAAVAEGMRFAARVSVEAGDASTEFVKRQDRLLDALGLTTLEVHAPPGRLLDLMRADKKSRDRVVRMVLVDGPGLWRCEPVDDSIVKSHLDAWENSKKGE